jgi:hypothetical protein
VRQLLLEIHIFPIIVFLSIILLFGCEKKYTSVIDSSNNVLFVSSPIFSLHVVNTDTIYAGYAQTPEDTLTIIAIASLKVNQTFEDGLTGSVRYSLGDYQSSLVLCDGTLTNFNPSDSVYYGFVGFKIQRSFFGDFVFKLWAQNQNGDVSNIFYLPLHIIRSNNAPIISNLTAPDTLHIGDTLSLTIKASDPDGLADLYEVGYRSLKPDGNYANSGNMILLYDDGKSEFPSGDRVAGDGIYTYTTNVPQTAQRGTYIYTFSALDKARTTSNTITKKIIILP